jgi:hypothetical protein
VNGNVSNDEFVRPFRLNEPAVISDIIDGEVVIMNLERGSYYGLDQVGADVWQLILAGRTSEEIVSLLCKRFSVEQTRANADVTALIAKMIEQDLIIPDGDRGPAENLSTPEIAADRYTKPDLTIYSDMKDLLAFDPPLPNFEPPREN